MKLVVFGATGGTGQQIVSQALAAGHAVAALVRDPAKMTVQHAHLTLIQGNVLDRVAVDRALAGADAVFISLGNTANNPNQIVSAGTAVVLDAMKSAGVKRVIVISSLGVGDSKDQVPLFFKALIVTALRNAFQDKEAQEKLVMGSELDWTIIRPGGLTDGPATGAYRAGLDRSIGGQVARADVAAFALAQLASDDYLHKTPAIA